MTIRLLAPVLLLSLPTAAMARGPVAVPVIVGGEAELDACTSIGHVDRLEARGDNFLSVRAAPAASARATDRLRQGHIVWICQERGRTDAGAKWYGIVYGPEAQSRNADGVPPGCGVSTPIAKAKPYRGPCKSGWVAAAFIHPDAG